jgi:hypothetical protein
MAKTRTRHRPDRIPQRSSPPLSFLTAAREGTGKRRARRRGRSRRAQQRPERLRRIGIHAGIIDKLNKEVNAGLANPKLKTQLADLGGIILGGSSADFRTLITEETEKWGKVIRAANIKPE